MSKNFAVLGVAGYVAPKHLDAIKGTDNNLVAACDPHDSVGRLDSYSYNVSYFREFERFDRHLEKLRRKGEKSRVHFLSICTPNYLHDAHIRFALRIGANAICEKPLVLNPWNIDALKELEEETGRKIYTVLQLRVHPSIVKLKKQYASRRAKKKPEVVLSYVTSRGLWYLYSWKGAPEQSGGLVTNIGIHFFDALSWIFGKVQHSEVHYSDPRKWAGFVELERARVKWYLSIDKDDLDRTGRKGQKTYRSIKIDGKEVEFSHGFTSLHTEVYKQILKGKGYGVEDARPSIQLVQNIRDSVAVGAKTRSHPLLLKNQ